MGEVLNCAFMSCRKLPAQPSLLELHALIRQASQPATLACHGLTWTDMVVA